MGRHQVMNPIETDIAAYYDANTRNFLRFGHGRGSYSIHRAVWGPGVANREQAMQYINTLILKEIRRRFARRILDVGCGVGGSIVYLASKWRGRYTGITISSVQAEIGSEVLTNNHLAPACQIRRGDFSQRTSYKGLGVVDFAFAVESFLHAPNPDSFMHAVSAQLCRGGGFMICDDFLTSGADSCTPKQRGRLEDFRHGWGAINLRSMDEVEGIARRHGFQLKRREQLTPHLELSRPRDWLIRGFVSITRRFGWQSPWWRNMWGGDALQRSLIDGLIDYSVLIFEKT